MEDFRVQYWGIGRPFVAPELGKSLFGATVTGRFVVCANDSQLARLSKEIERTFGVKNPRISPLRITKSSVQPVFAKNTVTVGQGSDVVFPEAFEYCNTANFAIGSGNSLFAAYVAGETSGRGVISNPDFGVNILSKAEFAGDPWEGECTAELSQVWKSVRQRYSASANLGWFSLGSADYASLVNDLNRSGVITCKNKQGSTLDLGQESLKQAHQIFDLVKSVFERINKEAAAGKGFFRFEPVKDADDLGTGKASTSFPWSVSVNASYSENHFKQKIIWTSKFVFDPRLIVDVPVSMTLAVLCNYATEQRFNELLNPSEPCIDEEKAERFSFRYQAEAHEQNVIRGRLKDRYATDPDFPKDKYDRILDELDKTSLTEDPSLKKTVTFKAAQGEKGMPEGSISVIDYDGFIEGLLSRIK